MEKGLISVIIPVYNVEKYLRECLDSVLAQTYTCYEVIMVDDGSTDSSGAICDEYAAKDGRFRVIHKENGGASTARNAGLANVSGEYVFFLDSDDRIVPEAFEKLYHAAVSEKADFIFAEAETIDDSSERSSTKNYSYRKKYPSGAPYLMMREMSAHREFHVVIWNILFSSDFLKKQELRFQEGIIYEDLILSYQIYALAVKAAHLHECVYYRRLRENSVMTSRKTEKNFISAMRVYDAVSVFSDSLRMERRNDAHVVRCAFNALNDFGALNANDKKKHKAEYKRLKADLRAHGYFGSDSLRYRCRGKSLWAAYKAIEKLFIGQRNDFGIYVRHKAASEGEVMMLIPHMIGGGAERVAAQLINQMDARGYDTTFILSADKRDEVVRSDLNDNIPLFLMSEEMPKEPVARKAINKVFRLVSSLLCKPFELINKPVPAAFAKLSVASQYSREIDFVRGLLKADPELTLIAFLQPTIPIALLAAKGLPNKIVISERADPNRLMKKRYGRKFIEKYYTRADAAVFQTKEAKKVYPECVSNKGTVIPNPIKPGLPELYHGERNRNITTFCRISNQKNLPLLVDAFAMFHKDHGDYTLRIIGDAPNEEGVEVVRNLKELIRERGVESAVVFEPFMKNVHETIIKDAMYVNSSDYEGISNAMLEAMAIGMPVICTDCPIGGASATITDGENGLLVPVGDAAALCDAMKRVAGDASLAEHLSSNAAKLRDELSLERITDRWLGVLGGTNG